MELRGMELVSLGTPQQGDKTIINGRIQNISQGGACLQSNELIPESSLVRCAIIIPGTRAAIPTLMQVRWTQRNSTNGKYRIALQFLL
jgi:PilZ domain